MLRLEGDNVYLRALEAGDLQFLYELENNTEIWEISGTLAPYSKHVLKKYLENAHRDIYEVKQLRLCICNSDDRTVGLIDLFDFDPKHRRAGIGVIISARDDRKKGLGTEALSILLKYAFTVLDLHQIYANVSEDNSASLSLFEKMGFQRAGTKKDWIRAGDKYKSEILFQKINS